jgi:hypothetical protein
MITYIRTGAVGVAMLAFAAALAAVPGSASAEPTRADIVVGLTADPMEIGPAGGPVALAVSVRNAGGADAVDTTLKLQLPAGAALSFDSLDGWTCDAAALKCKGGTLAAGVGTTLQLRVTLAAGAHDDIATISATAQTRSPESSTANNTGRVTVRYVARPDLTFSYDPQLVEISYLGGMGARGYVHARATNIGTVAAPDVRFEFRPPPGAWMDMGSFFPDRNECDLSGPIWVCIGGPVAPGEFAYLNLALRFPAGTPGDMFTMPGSASTTATERSLANNTGEVVFRYVVPPPADITVNSVSVVPAYQVKANEPFDVYVELDNIGGQPAEDVKVRVPLAPTVEPVSLDPEFPGWTCAVVDQAIECARAEPYDISQPYNRLRLRMRAGPGTTDGPLMFTATASTSSPEITVDNNAGEGSTIYVAEGLLSGRAWHDLDRDGRREAGEPYAYAEIGKIELVLDGTEPNSWDTPRAYPNDRDGTYLARLKPGRYVVYVYLRTASTVDFTTPDVGDDATDSDIVTSIREYWAPRGLSAVVEVRDGSESVVDFGLVPIE